MSTTPSDPPFSPRPASLAQPSLLQWLWPGRIAAGRLTVIDGDPGEGKSLLALDVAARLSSARELPDGYRHTEPAAVLLLTAEDDVQDTVIPRLRTAGADLERVYTWTGDASGPLVFPAACARLQELIEQTKVRLVVIDPFFAFLGPDIGSLNDLMIRRALKPLAELAAATAAAFILIRHLSKGSVGKQAAYRGLGSIAILGAARTAFLVAKDPADADLRVLACTKNNLAAFPPALGFRLTAADGIAKIVWTGPVARTADDLVQAGRQGQAVP
jgi:RecA-family ATPase